MQHDVMGMHTIHISVRVEYQKQKLKNAKNIKPRKDPPTSFVSQCPTHGERVSKHSVKLDRGRGDTYYFLDHTCEFSKVQFSVTVKPTHVLERYRM
jgi:hypothetical protein